METAQESAHLERAMDFLHHAKKIIVNSGHIYWLRLAEGMIDGHLDPFGGKPLYEMFASTIAQKNGCVVTDTNGKIFDASHFLKVFQHDPDARYYSVVARSARLHAKPLSSLQS